MSILLLLVSGVLFAFVIVCWKNQFQRNIGEMSSNSTSLALVRPYSSTGSTKRNTDETLSVNSHSRNILFNCPYSIAIQKRILVNLRTMEYKLVRLEHLLITKGSNGVLVNQKSADRLTECNGPRSNH